MVSLKSESANIVFVFLKSQHDTLWQILNPDGTRAVWPIQGSTIDNNLFDVDYNELVHDAEHLDFRPVRNSAADTSKVGPYTRSSKFYWIPGRQEEKASEPVPPTGSVGVRAGRRRHVMWLNAYNCYLHQVNSHFRLGFYYTVMIWIS